MLRLDDIGAANHETLAQPRAHRLGDIGHRVEIGHAAMVKPVEHLFRAQLGRLRVQPRILEQFADARAGQADQVDTTIIARRDVTRDGNGIHLTGDRHEIGVCHDCACI